MRAVRSSCSEALSAHPNQRIPDGTPDFVIKGRGSGPSKTGHFRPPPWENPPKHRPQTLPGPPR
eukprot:3344689-Pyramimonas_sp.AAC.1